MTKPNPHHVSTVTHDDDDTPPRGDDDDDGDEKLGGMLSTLEITDRNDNDADADNLAEVMIERQTYEQYGDTYTNMDDQKDYDESFHQQDMYAVHLTIAKWKTAMQQTWRRRRPNDLN